MIMKTEIEAKYLAINEDSLRQKLTESGAICEQPMRLMRRAIVQNDATGRDSYVRLRDEGDKVTLTLKKFESLNLGGAKEIESIVSDFDAMYQILEGAGLKIASFQESRRETWRLGEVEIVIDEWPWLLPYIEIEGPTEDDVRTVAERLGFRWDDAVFGDVMVAYRAEYPHLGENDTVGSLEKLTFDSPKPDMFNP